MSQSQELFRAALERANQSEEAIEKNLSCDVVCYIGSLQDEHYSKFRESIETIARKNQNQTPALAICLTTPGGVAEAVEGMVKVVRHHYQRVYFIVPQFAMSAGTIFCMSGDEIYMDYSSCLGPIDPQVLLPGTNELVPALGYLDKVEELAEKSRKNTISSAELMLLREMNLALLRRYEQARDLSVELLKEWLEKYKFAKSAEKQKRAKKIGEDLSDNKKWHSHGRRLHIGTLNNDLNLEIKNFGEMPNLNSDIRLYHSVLLDYFRYYVMGNTPSGSNPLLIYNRHLA